MKNLALKYGSVSSAIMIFGVMLPLWIWGKEMDMIMGEVAGYSAMIIALTAIFFGIKSYKEQLNDPLTFKSAFAFGTFVNFIAALIFGIFSFVLYQWLMPEFLPEYLEQSREAIRTNAELTSEQIETQLAELEAGKDLWLSPTFGGLLMFVTVFPIGLVVTMISSVILRDKN